MILYNVTVNIDKEVEEEWKEWMKNKHIPDVLATGLFIENKFFRLLQDEPQGTTYSIQYFLESIEKFQEYEQNHAHQLQQEHMQKYGNKAVAFRTLLESA